MTLIVGLTGTAGLLASYALLQLDMANMAVRYPLALTLAYLFFLLLIWLWLHTNAVDHLDALDIPSLPSGRGPSLDNPVGFRSGGGGDFGGGGASGSFDAPADGLLDSGEGPMSSVGEAVGTVTEADELAIPLLALALAAGLALASLWVIYVAPALLAEVLVDGGLSYALYRHLHGQDPSHWVMGTLRHTVWPFIATAVLLAAVGAGLSHYAPGARTLSEAVAQKGAAHNRP